MKESLDRKDDDRLVKFDEALIEGLSNELKKEQKRRKLADKAALELLTILRNMIPKELGGGYKSSVN
jgi:hypothetical protein